MILAEDCAMEVWRDQVAGGHSWSTPRRPAAGRLHGRGGGPRGSSSPLVMAGARHNAEACAVASISSSWLSGAARLLEHRLRGSPCHPAMRRRRRRKRSTDLT
jgi:hypothetical protein